MLYRLRVFGDQDRRRPTWRKPPPPKKAREQRPSAKAAAKVTRRKRAPMQERATDDRPAALEPQPEGYAAWLADVKVRVYAAQQRAALAVNTELLGLYWQIGRDLSERRREWGSGVIAKVSSDLRASFPDMKGFSPTNLRYMRLFAEAWPEGPNHQQPVDDLPWGHNVVLLTRLKDPGERLAYARAAITHGWSRNVLDHHIDLRTVERSDKNALVKHVTQFLLELGAGFAFVGRQRLLDVDGDEFFLDLLFYHLKLRSYVVIELKATKFKPEHLGQLGFYCTAIDAQVKAPDDAPTIGLLLCKTKRELVVEYALRSSNSPIGVSEYRLIESLPKDLEASLPSIKRLEEELSKLPAPRSARLLKKAGKKASR